MVRTLQLLSEGSSRGVVDGVAVVHYGADQIVRQEMLDVCTGSDF